jgi:prefoldin subunit 5
MKVHRSHSAQNEEECEFSEDCKEIRKIIKKMRADIKEFRDKIDELSDIIKTAIERYHCFKLVTELP